MPIDRTTQKIDDFESGDRLDLMGVEQLEKLPLLDNRVVGLKSQFLDSSFPKRRILQGILQRFGGTKLVRDKTTGEVHEVKKNAGVLSCGYSIGGHADVELHQFKNDVKIRGVKSCKHRLCPVCYRRGALKLLEQTQSNLSYALAHNWSCWFITYTKEKITNVERSYSIQHEWDVKLAKIVKQFNENHKRQGSNFCSLSSMEFSFSKSISYRDEKGVKIDGVSPVHFHTHQTLLCPPENLDLFPKLKNAIRKSYLKHLEKHKVKHFLKRRNKARQSNTLDIREATITEALSSYLYKVERDLGKGWNIASEIASSQDKSSKSNYGLFQLLDELEKGSMATNKVKAFERTIARVFNALYGESGMRLNKGVGFFYSKRANKSNLSVLARSWREEVAKKRIEQRRAAYQASSDFIDRLKLLSIGALSQINDEKRRERAKSIHFYLKIYRRIDEVNSFLPKIEDFGCKSIYFGKPLSRSQQDTILMELRHRPDKEENGKTSNNQELIDQEISWLLRHRLTNWEMKIETDDFEQEDLIRVVQVPNALWDHLYSNDLTDSFRFALHLQDNSGGSFNITKLFHSIKWLDRAAVIPTRETRGNYNRFIKLLTHLK